MTQSAVMWSIVALSMQLCVLVCSWHCWQRENVQTVLTWSAVWMFFLSGLVTLENSRWFHSRKNPACLVCVNISGIKSLNSARRWNHRPLKHVCSQHSLLGFYHHCSYDYCFFFPSDFKGAIIIITGTFLNQSLQRKDASTVTELSRRNSRAVKL